MFEKQAQAPLRRAKASAGRSTHGRSVAPLSWRPGAGRVSTGQAKAGAGWVSTGQAKAGAGWVSPGQPTASVHRFYEDPSFWSLFTANIITIVFALSQNLDFFATAWIYWAQSVIIGISNFFRIMNLEKFSTEGLYVNGKAVEPTPQIKKSIAFFFLFHYNVFHLVYAITFAPKGLSSSKIILSIPIFIFLLNHFFSYKENAPKERNAGRNIGSLMFFPYLRIIPMHLTVILFGLYGGAEALIIFLILKTLADIAMHAIEHRWWRASA